MHRKWYRLDTAALIFPAITRRDWCNAFRVSATLTEAVDPEILQQAVSDLRRHFPNFFVTLRKGFFWYYLEESPEPVSVRGDYAYPLTFMGSRELKRNCLPRQSHGALSGASIRRADPTGGNSGGS